MADAGALRRKGFLKWFWEDVVVAFAVAAGIDVLIKTQWPKLLTALSEMVGNHLKGKVLNDKRAEILEDFRVMKADETNIDNLIRRHKESIDHLREARFVELLCKVCPDSKDPANGRRSTFKYLNDLSDEEFDQMFYLLDHDVVLQYFQRGRDRTRRLVGRLSKDMSSSLHNITQWLRSHLGKLGERFAIALETIFDRIGRFLSWMFGSPLRILGIAAMSLIGSIFLYGIFRGRNAPETGSSKQRVSSVFGAAAVILLIATVYHLLVPTSLDKTLWYVVLLLLLNAFFFWNVVRLRTLLLLIVALLAPVFFLGGEAVALTKTEAGCQTVWKNIADYSWHKNGSLQPQTSAEDALSRVLSERKNGHQKISGQATDTDGKQKNAPPAVASPSDEHSSQGESGNASAAAGNTAAPQTTKDLPSILPISGDEGPLLVKMQGCWYSAADVMTCAGSLLNRSTRQRRVYLMDSEGVADNGVESRHFNVWTFGGSIKFDGGGNVAMLIPQTRETFLITFREPEDGVNAVGFTLTLQGDDAINHEYAFAKIPTIPGRY